MKNRVCFSFMRMVAFSVLCCYYTQGRAQYDSLATDSNIWVIAYDDYRTPFTDDYFAYYSLGDTILNSIVYKKIYRLKFKVDYSKGWPDFEYPYRIDSITIFGAVRDENKKVYAILFKPGFTQTNCPINLEYLLYDFSVNVGDTLNLCITNGSNVVIQDICAPPQSTRWGTKSFNCNAGQLFYEGVGSEKGLFERISYVEYVRFQLTNFCKGSFEKCNIVLASLNEPEKKYDFSISPNPANEIIIIEATKKIKVICIRDYSGRIVIEKNNPETVSPGVNISTLKAGFYILSINDEEGNTYNAKIIKQ